MHIKRNNIKSEYKKGKKQDVPNVMNILKKSCELDYEQICDIQLQIKHE